MLGLFTSRAKVVPAQPNPPPAAVVAKVEVHVPVVAPHPPAAKEPTGLLNRQPVVDINLGLHGYTLVFETPGEPVARPAREAFENYRLLVPESEKTKAFVPCTREMLLGPAAELPANAVLALTQSVEPDDEVMAACHQLRRKGCRFALDGLIPEPNRTPMLEFVDYLTVDFQASDEAARAEVYALADSRRASTMATNVPTTDMMQLAQKEGCKLFQGNFLTSPYVLPPGAKPPKSIADNQLICLRLMTLLSEDPVNIAAVEKLIMMDSALVYRLLRLVNSALYSLNSRITSIRSALMIVGTDEFRKLITMTLASIFASSNSLVLVTLAVERARFCETLAPQLREPGPKLYLTGMLSLVDSVLKLPMAKVLNSLPLESDMTAALSGEPGVILDLLDLIRAYQSGNWKACIELQQQLRIDDQLAAKVYVDAAHWADKVGIVTT